MIKIETDDDDERFVWLNPDYIVKVSEVPAVEDVPAFTTIAYHNGEWDEINTAEPAEELIARIERYRREQQEVDRSWIVKVLAAARDSDPDALPF